MFGTILVKTTLLSLVQVFRLLATIEVSRKNLHALLYNTGAYLKNIFLNAVFQKKRFCEKTKTVEIKLQNVHNVLRVSFYY